MALALTYLDALDLLDTALDRGTPLRWADLTRNLGRCEPALLLPEVAEQWRQLFPGESLAQALAEAWQGADNPEDAATRGWWVRHLRSVGYLVNGEPAQRPTEPVTLYRGSPDPLRMSWTPDPGTAELFADGHGGRRGAGQVWQATATAGALLMAFDGTIGWLGERELVVDVSLLRDVVLA